MNLFSLPLTAALFLALGAHSTGAMAAEGGRALDARDYRNCVDLSARAPQAAHDVASDWLVAGGGIPAQHCAALSLAGLGRFDEAALALEAAAENLRIAEMNGAYTGFFRRGEGLVGELLGQAGNAWLLAGDAMQAYTAFSQGLTEVAPGSPPARALTIDRARASGIAGDYVAALEDLDKAVDWAADWAVDWPAGGAHIRAKERAEILVLRASAYRNLGRIEEAMSDLERAFALIPDDREALLERGNLSLMTDDWVGAEADWRQVIRLYPASPAAAAATVNLEKLEAENSSEAEED
ncbi:MAG: hypothetical protein IID51_08690 [Proteobacteria bacterium]|nr:hypothetical protein [Pseudomonadota bacterium]